MSIGKPTVAQTRYRNASTDRVGNSNIAFDSVKNNDSKEVFKAEASNENEKQTTQLEADTKPRKYAKLIADYSLAMERRRSKSTVKELPSGLLSRLPIESIVSSWRPFEKSPKRERTKNNGIASATSSNGKQSNHALTQNSLKIESRKNPSSLKGASQKREYFTKNNGSGSKTEELDNKTVAGRNRSASSQEKSFVYFPNDFDVICELTEKYQHRKNKNPEWSDSRGIDYKVKAPSSLVDDFALSNPSSGNNPSPFDIVAARKKVGSEQESKSIRKAQKSALTQQQKSNAFPCMERPESTVNQKHEKDGVTSSNSVPDIPVIYSQQMHDFEIARLRKEESPSSPVRSKLKQPEKVASISKTKQYIKEELEKQKDKRRRKSVDELTNNDRKEVEIRKTRWINEKLNDKSAKLSKVIDRDTWTQAGSRGVEETRWSAAGMQTASKKSKGTNANALPETKKRARKSPRKDSIDHEYKVEKVREPLKPLEKRKDGTLIDYGLKVPTRRPKKQQQQPATDAEKKNSSGHRRPDLCRNSKSSVLGTVTSTSQQLLHEILRNPGQNGKSNNGNNNSIQL